LAVANKQLELLKQKQAEAAKMQKALGTLKLKKGGLNNNGANVNKNV